MNTSLDHFSHHSAAALLASPSCSWRTAAAARAMRLTPLALLMLASLTLPMLRSGWLWVMLLQIIAAAALLLVRTLRKRLIGACPLSCLALLSLVVAGRSLADAHVAVRIGLSVTLALCIAHACLRTASSWSLRHGVCIANYLSSALLLYVCSQTATPAQSQLTAWIVLTASAVCCAFIPWVEVKTISHSISIGSLDTLETFPAPHFATLHARLQQLEAENDTLRASKRDQETFVYAISHDLRAPLRAIDAFSRLLGDHLAQPLTPRARHDLAGIHAGIGRMQDLLNCWLNIARCERAALRRTKVDLSVIAESLARELQMLDPKRSVIMTVDAELTASADPVLVRELLQNLLSMLGNSLARVHLRRCTSARAASTAKLSSTCATTASASMPVMLPSSSSPSAGSARRLVSQAPVLDLRLHSASWSATRDAFGQKASSAGVPLSVSRWLQRLPPVVEHSQCHGARG